MAGVHHDVGEGWGGGDDEVHDEVLFRGVLGGDAVVGVEAGLLFGAACFDAGPDKFELVAEEDLAAAFGVGFDAFADGFAFEVVAVVAGVGVELAAVDLDDAGGDAVEEVAVVGDEEDGTGEVAEVIFEPDDGFGIEVVGGFVEQEDVWLGDEGAGEGDAAFFATGEGVDEAVGGGGAEAAHEGVDAGVEVPAVEQLDLVEEFGFLVAFDGAGFVAVDEDEEVCSAGADVSEDGGLFVEGEFLGEVAEAEVLAFGDGTAIGLFGASDDAHEAAFTAAVAADEAEFFAFVEGHDGVVKDGL